MNNATHTPGPWIVEDYFVFSSNILRIADCDCDDQDMPESEISANAHLIAAAPAIYEALQDAYEKLCYLAPDKFDDEEHAANWQRDLSTMLAALAQAEGRG